MSRATNARRAISESQMLRRLSFLRPQHLVSATHPFSRPWRGTAKDTTLRRGLGAGVTEKD